ncbi:MAG: exosortase C-terminal domain/associated protein EpsI [Vicinamibacterales bacterium]
MKATPLVRALVISACLLGGWAYLASASRAEALPPREPLSVMTMAINERTGKNEPPFEKEILDVLGVDDYIVRTYYQPETLPVGLYVGFYTSQRQGDTIHSPLNCLPGAGWQAVEQGHAFIDVKPSPSSPTTRRIEVNRVVIGKGLDKQLVYYWYQSRDRVVASEYWGKIYTVLDAVRYNRTDAALVRVIVPIPEARLQQAADDQAIEFVKGMFPLLEKHLPI